MAVNGAEPGFCAGMRPRFVGAAEGVGEGLLPTHLTSGISGQGGEPDMAPGRQPGQPELSGAEWNIHLILTAFALGVGDLQK